MIKIASLTALALSTLMAAGVAQAAETHKAAPAASVAVAASAAVSASKPVVAKDKAPVVKAETAAVGGVANHDDKSIPTTPKIGPRGTEGNVKVKTEVKAGLQH